MPEPASARMALIAPSGGDAMNLWPGQQQAIRNRLEAVGAMYRTGVAADRPVVASSNIGLFFIATDTGVVSVSTGSSWVSLNAAPASLSLSQNDKLALQLTGAAAGLTIGGDVTLYRAGPDILRSDDAVTVARAAGNIAFASALPADTFYRFQQTIEGVQSWGSGAGAQDTNLFRSGPDILKTDDTFQASQVYTQVGAANQILLATDGRLYFGSAADTNLYRAGTDALRTDDSFSVSRAAAGVGFGHRVGSESFYRWQTVDGALEWGSGAGAVDTNLRRGGVDLLRTDDQFDAALDVLARTGAAGQVRAGTVGPASEAGVAFGSALDTVLFRSGTDALATDDSFRAARLTARGGDVDVFQNTSDTVPKARVSTAAQLLFGLGGASTLDTVIQRGAAGRVDVGPPASPLPVSVGVEDLRWVRGSVNSNGTVNSGSGYSVVRNSAGDYTVTFTTAYPSGPVPMVIPNGSTQMAVIVSVANGSFRLRVYEMGTQFSSSAPTLVDAAFYFMSVGPR